MDAKTLGETPANPISGHSVDASGAYCGDVVYAKGMTLRQHYAGLAMAAMLSNPAPEVSDADFGTIAEAATEAADALLAHLAEDQP